jgi:hypothetical protein
MTGLYRRAGSGALVINRARFAPEREADRLGLTNALPGGHPDLMSAENTNTPNDFGPTPTSGASGPGARPAGPHERLSRAAATHARDMRKRAYFALQSIREILSAG